MKNVSFIKGDTYRIADLDYLQEKDMKKYFIESYSLAHCVTCTESFTAEITVKIVPYEQN